MLHGDACQSKINFILVCSRWKSKKYPRSQQYENVNTAVDRNTKWRTLKDCQVSSPFVCSCRLASSFHANAEVAEADCFKWLSFSSSVLLQQPGHFRFFRLTYHNLIMTNTGTLSLCVLTFIWPWHCSNNWNTSWEVQSLKWELSCCQLVIKRVEVFIKCHRYVVFRDLVVLWIVVTYFF